jgi:hypothetical protein
MAESEDSAVRPMRFLRRRMFAHDDCGERVSCLTSRISEFTRHLVRSVRDL